MSDVATFDPPWLRNAVLLLPRQPLIFIGSIGSNISYGRAGTPLAAIQAAGMAAGELHARFFDELPADSAAGLHDLVVGLPDGYAASVESSAVSCNPALQQV
jgi:ABC-type multidrug transport system fused ATPase/permease subunit